MAEIQSPNIFGSFMAGRQARQGEQQQEMQNQFLARQQQMQDAEFQAQQEAQARQQQFNQLVGQYVGQDTVDTLGPGRPAGPVGPVAKIEQLYALDPARAMQLQQFQQAQQQARREQEVADAKQKVLKAQYALRPGYDSAVLLRVGFPEDAEDLREAGVDVDNLTDEQARQIASQILAHYGPIAGIAPADEGGEQFTLSEGQTRFDANGKPIASVSKQDDPLDPTPLRKEFSDATGGFQTIRSAYENVKSAENSDAGDTQLVLNYMRVISPGIRIQPGEAIADAASVPGLSAGVVSVWNKLVNGGKLSPAQRGELRSQAKTTYEKQRGLYKQTRSRYERLAREGKVDPWTVTGDDLAAEEASAGNGIDALLDKYAPK